MPILSGNEATEGPLEWAQVLSILNADYLLS